MGKRSRIFPIIVTLWFALKPPCVRAETLPQGMFVIPHPRIAGVGGLHATHAEDFTTLWTNPAGLYGLDSQFKVSELSLSLGGPVFSLSNIILRAAGGEDMNVLLTDPEVLKLFTGIYTSFDLVGPLSFGYVGKGLGFAVVNGSSVEMRSVGSTTYRFTVAERLLFYGGYAFRMFPAKDFPLDAGINLKAIIQGSTRFQRTLLEIPDLASEGTNLLMNNPYSMVSGIGIDAGVLFPLGKSFKVGLVARNLFTPTTRSDYTSLDDFLSNGQPLPAVKGRVPLDLSLGIQYAPSLGIWELYFRKLKLMVDYNDSLDFWTHPETAVNPILKVGIGAEVQVLEVLWLRAGVYQGLLSAGFGLDYGAVQVHFAVFGRELSIEPGINPVYNIAFGIEFTLK